jgi:hypothetical protein
MTIKSTVYSTHQKFKNLTSPTFKLSHVYELFAAALGFNSYAALKSDVMLTKIDDSTVANQDAILQKAFALGYKTFPAFELARIMEAQGLCALSFTELAKKLKEGDHFIEDDLGQLLANETNAWANYCLALHYDNFSEEDHLTGSDYWYNQLQAGRQLSGVELTFALEYKQHLTNKSKYEFHLRKAASLGCDMALLDLAENFDDASFFEGNYQNVSSDPMRVAEIAENLGRFKDQHHWLTVAAEAGNIEAMRELVESYDSKDLTLCWTWVYLSRLLGEDFTKDRHYAINPDGSDYDDDVGGLVEVGGRDGIDLQTLEKQQEALARLAAEAIFKKL